MPQAIKVFPGRLKLVDMQWHQGGAGGPPMDTTGATFTILKTDLPSPPIITVVDESIGKYQLSLPPACTNGLKAGAVKRVTVALTFAAYSGGYSPDPLSFEVWVL